MSETNAPRLRVQRADDEPRSVETIARRLNAGFEALIPHDSFKAVRIMEKRPLEVVLAVQHMTQASNLELLSRLRKECPEVMRIIVSSYTEATGINAVGIHQYIAKPLHTDVRIVTATYRDLEQQLYGGRFRHHLYYRIAKMSLHPQPLCENPMDIEPLATHLIVRRSGALGAPDDANTAVRASVQSPGTHVQGMGKEPLYPAIPRETLLCHRWCHQQAAVDRCTNLDHYGLDGRKLDS